MSALALIILVSITNKFGKSRVHGQLCWGIGSVSKETKSGTATRLFEMKCCLLWWPLKKQIQGLKKKPFSSLSISCKSYVQKLKRIGKVISCHGSPLKCYLSLAFRNKLPFWNLKLQICLDLFVIHTSNRKIRSPILRLNHHHHHHRHFRQVPEWPQVLFLIVRQIILIQKTIWYEWMSSLTNVWSHNC